jgi:hypothetical protein
MNDETIDLIKILKFLCANKRKIVHNLRELKIYTELSKERIIYLLEKYQPSTIDAIAKYLLYHYENCNGVDIEVSITVLGELALEYGTIEEIIEKIRSLNN